MTKNPITIKVPTRRNKRSVFLGLAIVLISIFGVWLTININDSTEEYLVAAQNAASGSVIQADSLKTVRMNLGASGKIYAQPGDLKIGYYLIAPVEVGQLIPFTSVTVKLIDERQPVIVSSTMSLPKALKAGDFVDVWISDFGVNNKFSAPSKYVMDAEVVEVIEQSGMLGDQPTKVQLLVPAESVPDIVDSIASKDAISLVLKRNLALD